MLEHLYEMGYELWSVPWDRMNEDPRNWSSWAAGVGRGAYGFKLADLVKLTPKHMTPNHMTPNLASSGYELFPTSRTTATAYRRSANPLRFAYLRDFAHSTNIVAHLRRTNGGAGGAAAKSPAWPSLTCPLGPSPYFPVDPATGKRTADVFTSFRPRSPPDESSRHE